jgi:hypothetical protein
MRWKGSRCLAELGAPDPVSPYVILAAPLKRQSARYYAMAQKKV